MRLRRHLAAAPPEREENADVVTQLPHAEVDLNALGGDRLRRFLDAYRVEIHHDVRTSRRSAAMCAASMMPPLFSASSVPARSHRFVIASSVAGSTALSAARGA